MASLPSWTTEASISHESKYGHVRLKGVFLWAVVLLVVLVVL